MTRKLLGGAGLAVVIALSSSAWAGSENTLSDGNTTTTNSEATAVAVGIGNKVKSISESYNTSIEGVATQTLEATVSDTTVTAQAGSEAVIYMGDARASSGHTSGVVVTGANSAIGGIVQQGVVMGVGGSVKF